MAWPLYGPLSRGPGLVCSLVKVGVETSWPWHWACLLESEGIASLLSQFSSLQCEEQLGVMEKDSLLSRAVVAPVTDFTLDVLVFKGTEAARVSWWHTGLAVAVPCNLLVEGASCFFLSSVL